MMPDKDKISDGKLRELGIKDNKYEITLKFEGDEVFLIAAVLLVMAKFGFRDPAEFIKFIIHQFNKTLASLIFNGNSDPDKKETMH